MSNAAVNEHLKKSYEFGWSTDIETDSAPPGLNEDIVRFISKKKEEPEWLLEWRLKAYRHWKTMKAPEWAEVHHPPINFDEIVFYSAPKDMSDGPKSLDEVDPKLLETYEKLGIPLHERAALAGVAVDAVFDSVSVATTFKETLSKAGVIFCPLSEAVHSHPELVKKYLGTVVPIYDNYYVALNSAVFSDGSFVFIPKGVRCPMELSTYFRINAANTGQFERTLIVAEDGAYVSYLEGCTAPMRDENQLHAAVVELVTLDDAEIKYSTVQNWYPGDEDGKGGIYNFVTKRGLCKGANSKISWTQVETGSAITWKYPSCVLKETTLLVSSTPSQSRTIYNKPIQVPKWCTLGKIPDPPLFRKVSRPDGPINRIGVLCALIPEHLTLGTTHNATPFLWETHAERTPSRILK